MSTQWSSPSLPKNPQWTQVAAPAYPTTTYQTGNLLQESGFNLLQEDNSKILYEYATLLGFQPTINSIVTVWN